MPPSNRRVTARITSEFRLAVEGVDPSLRRRHGNLSVGGVYFEGEEPIGEVGSVQWLKLAPLDSDQATEVMGRVCRVVTLDDLSRAQLAIGTALEFMPDSPTKAIAIERLVQRVVTLQLERDVAIHVDPAFDVRVDRRRAEPPGTREAPPLTIERLVAETNTPLPAGTTVRLALCSHLGETTDFSGEVIDVSPISAPGSGAPLRHRAEVRVRPRLDASADYEEWTASSSISEAVEALFSGTTETSPELRGGAGSWVGSRTKHMVGRLDRIRATSLLGLFEMERISGVLRLRREELEGRIYVSEGRLLDAVMVDSDQPPRDVLAQMVRWQQGRFDFMMQDVDQPDRIQCSTAALLLDLAREEDEAARGAQGEADEARQPSDGPPGAMPAIVGSALAVPGRSEELHGTSPPGGEEGAAGRGVASLPLPPSGSPLPGAVTSPTQQPLDLGILLERTEKAATDRRWSYIGGAVVLVAVLAGVLFFFSGGKRPPPPRAAPARKTRATPETGSAHRRDAAPAARTGAAVDAAGRPAERPRRGGTKPASATGRSAATRGARRGPKPPQIRRAPRPPRRERPKKTRSGIEETIDPFSQQ